MRASRNSLPMRKCKSTNAAAFRRMKAGVAAWLARLQADARVEREHLRGRGPIAALETYLARHYGLPYCVALNNATNGLQALAFALELRGAEVIATTVSYGATFAPFRLSGAQLVSAKIFPRSGLVDVRSFGPLLTEKTRAVLTSDIRGKAHDMFAVRRFCDRHGLFYIADGAQSFGLNFRGRQASSLADAVVVSFGPGKRCFAGEGGALLLRDRAIYERVLRGCQHPERYRREVSLTDFTDEQPINARMHPLAAVLALASLGVNAASL
jgi:dTDP-4-amino-4,6-dideoxygalactose transaminase